MIFKTIPNEVIFYPAVHRLRRAVGRPVCQHIVQSACMPKPDCSVRAAKVIDTAISMVGAC